MMTVGSAWRIRGATTEMNQNISTGTIDETAHQLGEIYLREGIGHDDCGCCSDTTFRGVEFSRFNVYPAERRVKYTAGTWATDGTFLAWYDGEFTLP